MKIIHNARKQKRTRSAKDIEHEADERAKIWMRRQYQKQYEAALIQFADDIAYIRRYDPSFTPTKIEI